MIQESLDWLLKVWLLIHCTLCFSTTEMLLLILNPCRQSRRMPWSMISKAIESSRKWVGFCSPYRSPIRDCQQSDRWSFYSCLDLSPYWKVPDNLFLSESFVPFTIHFFRTNRLKFSPDNIPRPWPLTSFSVQLVLKSEQMLMFINYNNSLQYQNYFFLKKNRIYRKVLNPFNSVSVMKINS